MSQTLILNQVFKDSDDFFFTVCDEVTKQFELPINDQWTLDWDTDIARRIFLMDSDDQEYTIRLWNIHDDENFIVVEYTLFKDLPDGSVVELLP
jgi:hypothetical protein